MSAIKIYIDSMSQPCRALVILCRAANIPFEYKQTLIKEGMNKTEEFTKIHPFQKVQYVVVSDNRYLLFFTYCQNN